MTISISSLAVTVLMSCFLVSCSPDLKPDPNATGERKYLLEKAEAGLSWKTRAEEMVRQSMDAGTYEKNAYQIQQAYARVDTNIQVWANAVTADSKLGRQVLENEQMHQQIESSLTDLSTATGIPPGKGWKTDLVVVLLKSFFPPAAPVVDQINLALSEAEAARLRETFRTAHQLVSPTELQAPVETAPPSQG